ncbi:hypothetical protein GDO81_024047 [Engystomops pustulosus]|uniref:tRNA-guanine(15) transglycosylase-like domain-containing protein n=1 Tax=Engystomops pustulosus TaxID=76066 RepID=A0AAV6Z8S6_ENGPU|nr:hypothetical protein GDO81_024047 [Engystomops pustulosus]
MGQQNPFVKEFPRHGPDLPHSQTPPANHLQNRGSVSRKMPMWCTEILHLSSCLPFLEERPKPSPAGVYPRRSPLFPEVCYIDLKKEKTKLAQKSVDRSLAFLDECLKLMSEKEALQQTAVIGAIEGGDLQEERLRSARETAKRPVSGFLLDGFQEQSASFEAKLNLISAVTAELPEDKPRLVHGIGRPDQVLDCIERGVDLFDSTFPYEVTERGCALSFTHQHPPDPETSVLEKEKPCNGERNEEESDPEIDQSSITSYEICLKEKRYREDFRPLLAGCTCYCCRNHSRAYVYHLLTSRELLAGILLMIHNFQQYFSFFQSVRRALRDGTFQDLKQRIQRRAP